MAANKGNPAPVKGVQVWFQPSANGRLTTAEVVTVEYSGTRRFVHRIGSIRLGVGRGDLVGLTPSEVSFLLVDALHSWLSVERSSLRAVALTNSGRVAAPAPPAGATGAALNSMVQVPFPGL